MVGYEGLRLLQPLRQFLLGQLRTLANNREGRTNDLVVFTATTSTALPRPCPNWLNPDLDIEKIDNF
jgi:hypothetical protein